jgi:hypothetical protein
VVFKKRQEEERFAEFFSYFPEESGNEQIEGPPAKRFKARHVGDSKEEQKDPV